MEKFPKRGKSNTNLNLWCGCWAKQKNTTTSSSLGFYNGSFGGTRTTPTPIAFIEKTEKKDGSPVLVCSLLMLLLLQLSLLLLLLLLFLLLLLLLLVVVVVVLLLLLSLLLLLLLLLFWISCPTIWKANSCSKLYSPYPIPLKLPACAGTSAPVQSYLLTLRHVLPPVPRRSRKHHRTCLPIALKQRFRTAVWKTIWENALNIACEIQVDFPIVRNPVKSQHNVAALQFRNSRTYAEWRNLIIKCQDVACLEKPFIGMLEHGFPWVSSWSVIKLCQWCASNTKYGSIKFIKIPYISTFRLVKPSCSWPAAAPDLYIPILDPTAPPGRPPWAGAVLWHLCNGCKIIVQFDAAIHCVRLVIV